MSYHITLPQWMHLHTQHLTIKISIPWQYYRNILLYMLISIFWISQKCKSVMTPVSRCIVLLLFQTKLPSHPRKRTLCLTFTLSCFLAPLHHSLMTTPSRGMRLATHVSITAVNQSVFSKLQQKPIKATQLSCAHASVIHVRTARTPCVLMPD